MFAGNRQNSSHEYVYQGSLPPLYYVQQLHKHRTNFVLRGKILSNEIKPRNGWNATKVGSHHVRQKH